MSSARLGSVADRPLDADEQGRGGFGRIWGGSFDGWLAAGLIVAFVLANLIGLDRVPFANADEAWIAEPGLRFWQHGAFASQLHGGFFGAERHFMLHPPLFSLIVGAVLGIFGVGLVQMRLVTLLMSAMTAAFTYRLGRDVLSSRHGLLAALLLTWCRTGPYQWEARPSGIVLVDLGRYARYDIAVPFFGMMGVLAMLPWLVRDGPSPIARWRFVLAGVCAGLAIACHPMGVIFVVTLIALGIVAVQARGERISGAVAPIAWMMLGLGVTLLPLIAYVYVGWDDAVRQQQLSATRWGFGNPWFYASNVAREWRRYISVGRGLQFGIPGAWLLVISSVAGVVAVLRGVRRGDLRLRLIAAALVSGFAVLTLTEREKFFFYLAALWPWIALTMTIAIVSAMQQASRVVRLGAIVLVAASVLDGVRADVQLAREAATRTTFVDISNRLRAQIPRDARVLALPTWWFGLESHVRDYRSLNVAMFFLQPQLQHGDGSAPTFAQRLVDIDADVLLFDQAMIDYVHGPRAAWAMEQGPGARNPGAEDLERFVATHTVRQVDLVDPSYGRFEIYYLRR